MLCILKKQYFYAKLFSVSQIYPKGHNMKFNNKSLYTRASLIFLVVHFVTFMILYCSEFVFVNSTFMTYLWYFMQKATFLLMPLVAAMLILLADAYLGIRGALLRLLPLSFAKMIYSLPYYYLVFVYDPFYDSADAIFFALIQSFAESIILYAFVLIIFYIMKGFLWLFNKTGEKNSELLSKSTVLDFRDPVSLTFMTSSLLCFLYFLIDEIITTVSIISRYSGRLLGGEIVYMVFSYAVDISLLALHYFALAYLKNRIVKERVSENCG